MRQHDRSEAEAIASTTASDLASQAEAVDVPTATAPIRLVCPTCSARLSVYPDAMRREGFRCTSCGDRTPWQYHAATANCVHGDHAACTGYIAPKVYAATRPCVCECHDNGGRRLPDGSVSEPTITLPVSALRAVLVGAGRIVAEARADEGYDAELFASTIIRSLEAIGTTFVPEPKPILHDCSVCQRPVVLRSGVAVELAELAAARLRETPAWQLNRCRGCGDPIWTGDGPPEEGYCDEGCNGDGSWLDRIRTR
jgi:hypothetical protein